MNFISWKSFIPFDVNGRTPEKISRREEKYVDAKVRMIQLSNNIFAIFSIFIEDKFHILSLGWISMMSDLRRGENRRRRHNGAALSDRDRLFCLSSYNLSLGFEEQSECEMCPNVTTE